MDNEISGDGSGEPLPEIIPMIASGGAKGVPADSLATPLESVPSAPPVPQRRELTEEEKKNGAKLIIDMTVDELRVAVKELMTVNKIHAERLKKYETSAKKISDIWWDKKEVKKRYIGLRDGLIKPKA